MVSPVQKIGDIAPMRTGASGRENDDPVRQEYQEGKALLERGEATLAAAALHNALIGFEERQDIPGMANALNQLGKACMQREDYDGAKGHFGRVEELLRELEDPVSMLALSLQMVEVSFALGNLNDALDRCLHILELYQANNNPKGSVEIIEKMAEIYLAQKDSEKAADAFQTIASIHRNFGHDKIAASYSGRADELKGQA